MAQTNAYAHALNAPIAHFVSIVRYRHKVS